MKIIILLVTFCILLVTLVNADIIIIEDSSSEILFNYGSSELDEYRATCGDLTCDSNIEDSSSCPLDCKVSGITDVGLTGGAAGATYEQIIDCPFGFQKINGSCIKVEEVVSIKEGPIGKKGIFDWIRNNTILFIATLIIAIFIFYRTGRFRGRGHEIKNQVEKNE